MEVTLFTPAAENEMTLKCLVLGEQNVGKTSILNTLIQKTFDPQSAPTIGIDFRVLRATVSAVSAVSAKAEAELNETDAKAYKLQIWDSAGQYRFRSIVSSYFRLAHIFIIVFDLTDHGLQLPPARPELRIVRIKFWRLKEAEVSLV